MMEPKYGIKSRDFNDPHIAKAKGIMDAVVQRLYVPDFAAIGFVTPFIKWLVNSKEFI
jgi:hypothetical protein